MNVRGPGPDRFGQGPVDHRWFVGLFFLGKIGAPPTPQDGQIILGSSVATSPHDDEKLRVDKIDRRLASLVLATPRK